MNKIPLNIGTQHLVEMFDKEKNEKKFFILINDEWEEISQDEYDTITRGK
jgi:hypothetical protein